MPVCFAALLRNGGLLADDVGLLVRHRGRTVRSYRWEEILQAGPVSVGFNRFGLAVLPEGGPYDVPGPNHAVVIGQVWMWRGPDGQTRARPGHAAGRHPVRVPAGVCGLTWSSAGRRGRRPAAPT
ncbi:hypothetical protein, partial [Micromonospora sp. NPDC005313]|uniref:hypothetical protein n=1 Tax=Micromonospora sp. NPDC005313 TaxID=3154296 RepID=UPI0033A3F571